MVSANFTHTATVNDKLWNKDKNNISVPYAMESVHHCHSAWDQPHIWWEVSPLSHVQSMLLYAEMMPCLT